MVANTVYNKIGEGYNYTRRADPYITSRLIALLQPQDDRRYVDLGCGTGNYSIKLTELGVNLVGIDPSALMLDEAKAKAPNIEWIRAQAEALPLADHSVDGVIATLTIHHWTDLNKGFRELNRVLKPGGRIVIFSFTKEQETGYWLNHFFPEMMKRTFQKAITLEAVTAAAEQAGLQQYETEKYFVQPDLQDLFGYSGKHNPEIYFDEGIRKGISAFSLLAEKEETEQGLKQLRACIDNGEFEQVKQQYENEMGDYLFIVLTKV